MSPNIERSKTQPGSNKTEWTTAEEFVLISVFLDHIFGDNDMEYVLLKKPDWYQT